MEHFAAYMIGMVSMLVIMLVIALVASGSHRIKDGSKFTDAKIQGIYDEFVEVDKGGWTITGMTYSGHCGVDLYDWVGDARSNIRTLLEHIESLENPDE